MPEELYNFEHEAQLQQQRSQLLERHETKLLLLQIQQQHTL